MATVGLCQAEIEANAFGMPNVQVAVRFGRESCVDCSSTQLGLRREVLFDFDFDEVLVGSSVAWFVDVIHNFDLPWVERDFRGVGCREFG